MAVRRRDSEPADILINNKDEAVIQCMPTLHLMLKFCRIMIRCHTHTHMQPHNKKISFLDMLLFIQMCIKIHKILGSCYQQTKTVTFKWALINWNKQYMKSYKKCTSANCCVWVSWWSKSTIQ